MTIYGPWYEQWWIWYIIITPIVICCWLCILIYNCRDPPNYEEQLEIRRRQNLEELIRTEEIAKKNYQIDFEHYYNKPQKNKPDMPVIII